jgi:inhibitor of cysteine peptidase
MILKICVVALVCLLLVSCSVGGNRFFFSKKDHAQVCSVKKNRIFRIELPANLTTGFNWNVESLDEEFFKVVSSGYIASRPMMPGSGGISWWEIEPLKIGRSQIKMRYYRKWEGPEKSADKFFLQLIIK